MLEKPGTTDYTKSGLLLFGGAAAYFIAYAAHVIQKPLLWLVTVVPDDAFYYLQIARHLAIDGISTFDGRTLTNGYHPGWMLLLTLIAKAQPDRVMLLRCGLAMALLLHLFTAILLIRLLRWHTSLFRASVGAALWLLNPLPLMLAQQVMETPLYLLAITCAVIVFQERVASHARTDQPFRPPKLDLFWFGVALSFAFWARTEAILLAFLCPILLALLIRFHTNAASFSLNWTRAVSMITAGFLLGVVPWFLFSWLATGHVLQNSGAMKALLAAQRYARLGWEHRLSDGGHYLISFWYGSTLNLLLGIPAPWLPVVQLTLLALMCLACVHLWRSGDRARFFLLIIGWLFAGTLAAGVLYGLFLTGTGQVWYQGNPGLVLFIAFAGAVAYSLPPLHNDRAKRLEMAGGTALCLLTVLLSRGLWTIPSVSYPWQQDIYESQPHFEAMIPAGARIGCFNAGIAGYFSPRQVVNLDGLVNGKIYSYWKAHIFDHYLQDEKIAYIMDDENALASTRYFCSRRLHLTPLASVPLRGWIEPKRYLWHVEPLSDLP